MEGVSMGALYYGNEPIEISDRLLAHVKMVVTTKLRRNERFTLSWVSPPGSGGGRTTLWLDPSIPLRFLFDSEEAEALDPELLRELANAANTVRGIVIESEPVGAPAPALAAV
jgi:hypothetical protein